MAINGITDFYNINSDVIKDAAIVEKRNLVLPQEIRNIMKCRNPDK